MTMYYKLGFDIGSTTIKLVVLDNKNEIIYSEYKRHLSDLKKTMIEISKSAYEELGNLACKVSITGSGGLSVSKWLNIPFVQEVIACSRAIEELIPETDVAIELGGEDAKITYFKGGMDQRMNGSCAGGTGAFIDQMAALLDTDASGLNELAKSHTIIYPIASRCGVFAKSDIQPLLNDGAKKEDIAASVFQAVVNQTIGGLACGRPIRGKVAFLGGPLYFLSELRKRFKKSLDLKDEDVIFPDNSQFFPGIGAALYSDRSEPIYLRDLLAKIEKISSFKDKDVKRLAPLFRTKEEYEDFVSRHKKSFAKRIALKDYRGKAFLGIDAGSTTIKLALVGSKGELLYSYYDNNHGDPLAKLIPKLRSIYKALPEGVEIAYSAVTGYGEAFIKAALGIDVGEIETVCHYRAADFFLPGVDFIIDIGGQDMKCMRIKDGCIESILLNEACSSGCGSFIESFAASLNMTVSDFAKAAIGAREPVDLGSKCTVFMNSKVKQAQKEGATTSDISAGLCYSVVKNTLYKVIKLREKEDLGEKIVVQGGTFLNDGILRAFELISGREVVRPEISGIMGAFGASLIARERYYEDQKESSLLKSHEIESLTVKKSFKRCKGCTNRCLLTINIFSDGGKFISGNRCELGLGIKQDKKDRLPNLYDYKYKRIFAYKPLPIERAKRGVIGIPRVLGMYENYPFWFTLFTCLGFRVELSSPSSKQLYEAGLDTIPSESVCYPAKLAHGHILDLINRGVKTIFFPCVFYEVKEYKDVNNHYNCPIVISYSEVLKNNIDEVKQEKVSLIMPFLNLNNKDQLASRLVGELSHYNISKIDLQVAISMAAKEQEAFKNDIRRLGEQTINYLNKHNKKGIVVCGKPYHLDKEVNHGIPQLINSLGFAVLTEDSVSHLVGLKSKLRVVDQWTFNSRIYRAAQKVVEEPNLELLQLNSFGCGLDAITSDQLEEILASAGKIFTLIKIDEGKNLGAAKIRIRSLKAAIRDRQKNRYRAKRHNISYNNQIFDRNKKKTDTILIPQMAPIHFELIKEAGRACGYKFETLPPIDKDAIDVGLKYVNNDVCYPGVLLIGQLINALESGKYDVNKTSVILTQTGGGCRATNYIPFLKLALKQSGFGHVPIISLNVVGLGKQPGFVYTPKLVSRLIMAVIYGDLLMKLLYRTRPYEKVAGSSKALFDKWNERAKIILQRGNKDLFDRSIRNIISDFDNLDVENIEKPKVAIVGEILAKYHPMANDSIIRTIEDWGAEVVTPDLIDFIYYSLYNSDFKYKYLNGSLLRNNAAKLSIRGLDYYRRTMVEGLKKSKRFRPPTHISELADTVSDLLSLGNHTGEGWLITAEMVDYLKQGVNNILCVQPLACLPNHITGRGMFKAVKERFPEANIAAIDYDPGLSNVNQENRLKLMLSVALREGDRTIK
ncbi:MAG: 2-hydroxyacyl-CoA dehydratase [Clostridiales bacterium]|nr:2-hydroxyacyl-CoA dehydratase [Clostridiales bacterium]